MMYVVCVGIVCLSGYIGSIVARGFVMKDKFYKELLSLCLQLKNNINFRQIKLSELFDESAKTCDVACKKHVILLKKLVFNEINENEFIANPTFYFLKKEEKLSLVKYFKGLGEGNDLVELGKYEHLKNYLQSKSDEAEKSRRNNEALSYKLSIAIGVVVAILIV